MILTETIRQTREAIAGARVNNSDVEVGFVPTMGALHAGHLSLIQAARRECDLVVVSIFVNPTQFGPTEDFEHYPRPLEADLEKCEAEHVDLVFNPSVEEMYGTEPMTSVRVRSITETLCGAQRPGHFDGVTLVVAKLFNIVAPDRAYFGRKDAQQAVVIERLVADLNMPIEIVVCPIVREDDGLALSSRNAYLDPQQRAQATSLYRSLLALRDAIRAGETDRSKILSRARDVITSAGPCEIEYLELVDPQTMQPSESAEGPLMAAVAVRIGGCRLMDNLLMDEGDESR